MRTSLEISNKLAKLIGNLIRRCIHEARMIPYILSQEEVIKMLMDDPALFERLVREEQTDQTAYSKKDLTAKIDAAAELARLDSLETFEKSFWGKDEVDLSPILDLTNQLTRTFAVYLGNASTLFDKSFEEFMNKFRQSLERAGLALRTVDLTLEDVAIFRECAAAYLSTGEFLQAFTFDRLLSSQIMIKEVVNLPARGFALREDLIRQSLGDEDRASALVKFILRISYVSHGAWDDLFPLLVRIVHQEPGLYAPRQLIDLIEEDVVFLCNLLCSSYSELRQQPSAERRGAIERSLEKYRITA
jgi:hypothetical protein